MGEAAIDARPGLRQRRLHLGGRPLDLLLAGLHADRELDEVDVLAREQRALGAAHAAHPHEEPGGQREVDDRERHRPEGDQRGGVAEIHRRRERSGRSRRRAATPGSRRCRSPRCCPCSSRPSRRTDAHGDLRRDAERRELRREQHRLDAVRRDARDRLICAAWPVPSMKRTFDLRHDLLTRVLDEDLVREVRASTGTSCVCDPGISVLVLRHAPRPSGAACRRSPRCCCPSSWSSCSGGTRAAACAGSRDRVILIVSANCESASETPLTFALASALGRGTLEAVGVDDVARDEAQVGVRRLLDVGQLDGRLGERGRERRGQRLEALRAVAASSSRATPAARAGVRCRAAWRCSSRPPTAAGRGWRRWRSASTSSRSDRAARCRGACRCRRTASPPSSRRSRSSRRRGAARRPGTRGSSTSRRSRRPRSRRSR